MPGAPAASMRGMYAVVGLLTFALFVFSLVDVIRHDESSVRFLPKVAWVFVVILIPLLGSALWWVLGHAYAPAPFRSNQFPDHMRVPVRRVEVRSTEQQLADLEREEREEALRAEIARRRRERGLDPA